MLLFTVSALCIPAQTNTATTANTPIMAREDLPQWVKDLRRWEIVTFGSIPFAMFTATFAMDMFRWSQANGMGFSDTGRRYAPWPLKSAGAIAMDNKEMERTIMIAAGLALTVGLTDLLIVQVKRYKARKRLEALPVGTTIINRMPWGEDTQEEPAEMPGSDETAGEGQPDTQPSPSVP